jgi:protein required for attachment to host cells
MKIAHGTLVMAADGKKALLFRNEGDEKYTVLQTLLHEEIANPATHEIGSDRPGRSFSSIGRRRSGYDDTDWHDLAEEHFAQRVADLLEQATSDGKAGLVIVAPPRFLGSLRDRLGSSASRQVLAEIGKDLVHHATDDLARAIAGHPERGPES